MRKIWLIVFTMIKIHYSYSQLNSVTVENNSEFLQGYVNNYSQINTGFDINISGFPFQFSTLFMYNNRDNAVKLDPAFNLTYDKEKYQNILRNRIYTNNKGVITDSIAGIKTKLFEFEKPKKPKIPKYLQSKRNQRIKELEDFNSSFQYLKSNSHSKIDTVTDHQQQQNNPNNLNWISKFFNKINKFEVGTLNIPSFNTLKMKSPVNGINLDYKLGMFNLYGGYGTEIRNPFSPREFTEPRKSITLAGFGTTGLSISTKVLYFYNKPGGSSILLNSLVNVIKEKFIVEGEYLKDDPFHSATASENQSYSLSLTSNLNKLKSRVSLKTIGHLQDKIYHSETATNNRNYQYIVNFNTRILKNTSLSANYNMNNYVYANSEGAQVSYFINVNYLLNTKVNLSAIYLRNSIKNNFNELDFVFNSTLYQTQMNLFTQIFNKKSTVTLTNSITESSKGENSAIKNKSVAGMRMNLSSNLSILTNYKLLIDYKKNLVNEYLGGARISKKGVIVEFKSGYNKRIIYQGNCEIGARKWRFSVEINNRGYYLSEQDYDIPELFVQTQLKYNF